MEGIEKRGANSWRITVTDGYVRGKKQQYRKTVRFPEEWSEARQRREAEKMRAALLVKMERGELTNARQITFADFSSLWVQEYATLKMRESTLIEYKAIIENRFAVAPFWHKKIHELRPPALQAYFNSLAQEGANKRGGKLAASTIRKYYNLLSGMLKTAVQWQYIVSNPLDRVEPPKGERKEAASYSLEQAHELLQMLAGEEMHHKTPIMLALFTGLRLGEVMGLEWKDLDFRRKEMHVKRASQYIQGKGIKTVPLKNDRSYRTLTMNDGLCTLLREYKAWQNKQRLALGVDWIESDRLFTKYNGAPAHPDSPSQWMNRFLKRKGLSHMKFHGTRHTNATLMIADNVDILTVMGRLGHSKASTTTDIYGHVLKKKDAEAANKLESMFSKGLH